VKIRKTLALTLILALILPLFAATGTTAQEPRYFENPEDAVVFFAQSLAQGDMEAALSAMDAQAAGETGDYRALAERIRLVSIATALLLPGEYTEYVTLNQTRLRAQQSLQLFGFIASLLVPEWSDPSIPLILDKEGQLQLPDGGMPLDDFIARLDPERLAPLTLKQVLRLDSAILRSESNQLNVQKQGAVYGFTEQADLMAIYAFGDQLYCHASTAVLRPEGWQLSSLNSPLINTSALGSAWAISGEAASQLLSSPDYLLLYDAPIKE